MWIQVSSTKRRGLLNQAHDIADSPNPRRSTCSAPGLRNVGSLKRPLAVQNTNTMLGGSAGAFNNFSNLSSPKMHIPAYGMSQASVAKGTPQDSAHALQSSPLDFLPQVANLLFDFHQESSPFRESRNCSFNNHLFLQEP